MVSYAQIKRERPGRITLLAVVCLLFGTPFFLLGLFGVAAVMEQSDVRVVVVILFICVAGAIAIVTGLGLLAMKPWARIAGVVACAIGTFSTLQGLSEVIREHSIANLIYNVAALLVQIWIGYFLPRPSTRDLFLQAQGTDERVLKI